MSESRALLRKIVAHGALMALCHPSRRRNRLGAAACGACLGAVSYVADRSLLKSLGPLPAAIVDATSSLSLLGAAATLFPSLSAPTGRLVAMAGVFGLVELVLHLAEPLEPFHEQDMDLEDSIREMIERGEVSAPSIPVS